MHDFKSPRYPRTMRICSASWSVVTIVTFALALLAVPISGANAPNGGIAYPYMNTLGQFPKDFFWQYAALGQLLLGVAVIELVGPALQVEDRVEYRIGKTAFSFASLILLLTYYIQTNVIPISLKNGETDGLALWIQYNPHGVFIALEELGYSLMILGLGVWGMGHLSTDKFLFAATAVALALAVVAVVSVVTVYGMDKSDRLEVYLVSIAWLESIFVGIRLAARGQKRAPVEAGLFS